MCACLPIIGPYFVKELRDFRKSYAQSKPSAKDQYSRSQNGSRGFKRFISDETVLEDTTALKDSAVQTSQEDIEMANFEEAHINMQGIDPHDGSPDTVFIQTEVEVTRKRVSDASHFDK